MQVKHAQASATAPPGALLPSCSDAALASMAALMRKLGLIGDALPGADAHGGVVVPLPPVLDADAVMSASAGVEGRDLHEALVRAAAGTAAAAACAECPIPRSEWRRGMVAGHPLEAQLLAALGEGVDGGRDVDGGGSADASNGNGTGGGGGVSARGSRRSAPRNYLDTDTCANGDFVHPATRMLLARRPTAYMLDPRAQFLAVSADRDEDNGDSHGGGEPADVTATPAPCAGGAGAGSKGAAANGSKGTAKGGGTGVKAGGGGGGGAVTPVLGASAAPSPATSHAAAPALTPSQTTGAAGESAGVAGAGPEDTAGTSGGTAGETPVLAATDGAAGGRARRSAAGVNYSLLSGKREKAATPALPAPTHAAGGGAPGPPLSSQQKKKRGPGRPSGAAAGRPQGPAAIAAA
eukprot:364508-Chlamydomonas_euryale.AAC.1